MKKTNTKKFSDVSRDDIVAYLDNLLNTAAIKDHSCNGLQVQGSDTIKKIGLAVDACMGSYEAAVSEDCQMLITHHGIIWGGIKSISGRSYDHVQYLMECDLNLYASHLPLDLHPEVGNNIQLAKMISLSKLRQFGFYKGIEIGFEGVLQTKMERSALVNILCEKLGTECSVLPFGKDLISSVAIVSGGGAEELEEAVEKGIDCFITGEPIHQNYHAALEAGINVIYAGHYHTEKAGVQALGKVLEKEFGVKTSFLDLQPMIERQSSGESIEFEYTEE